MNYSFLNKDRFFKSIKPDQTFVINWLMIFVIPHSTYQYTGQLCDKGKLSKMRFSRDFLGQI